MESNYKYRYSILNHPAHYYWDRRNGIGSHYPKKTLGHCLLNFKLGECTDIPIESFKDTLLSTMAAGTSMCIFPFEIRKQGRTAAVNTYKAGVEKAMCYLRSCGASYYQGVVQIVPQVKVNNQKKACPPYYVGPGMILDHAGKMIFGTFIRVKKVDFNRYELQNCVVKVAEEVFTDQNAPLHKVILKDILPDIIGSAYYFPLDSTIWANNSENAHIWLDVVMEVNKDNVPIAPITSLQPGFKDEDVCTAALKLLHTEEAL